MSEVAQAARADSGKRVPYLRQLVFIAVKTARVEIYDVRISRGMGGKGVIMLTGEVGDVTAAVEAGAAYATSQAMLSSSCVIAAPHEGLWQQI